MSALLKEILVLQGGFSAAAPNKPDLRYPDLLSIIVRHKHLLRVIGWSVLRLESEHWTNFQSNNPAIHHVPCILMQALLSDCFILEL
jgi:hypothetical protein